MMALVTVLCCATILIVAAVQSTSVSLVDHIPTNSPAAIDVAKDLHVSKLTLTSTMYVSFTLATDAFIDL